MKECIFLIHLHYTNNKIIALSLIKKITVIFNDNPIKNHL